MKKILMILLAVAVSLFAYEDSEKVSIGFEGVAINSKKDSFIEAVQKLGYKVVYRKENDGYYLDGKFRSAGGMRDLQIIMYASKETQNVLYVNVDAYIIGSASHGDPNKLFDRMRFALENSYGDPIIRKKGDGHVLMYPFKDGLFVIERTQGVLNITNLYYFSKEGTVKFAKQIKELNFKKM